MPKTKDPSHCDGSPPSGSIPKQLDILGRLPHEIVILISQYLEPFDIIRLRRVSRQWRAVLSSESVVFAAVKKYFPGQTIKPKESATYLEKRIRIEKGLFASEARVAPKKWFMSAIGPRSPQYSSGRLAWIGEIEGHHGLGVIVLNLWNGTVQYYFQNEEFHISRQTDLGLSDTLLVAANITRRYD